MKMYTTAQELLKPTMRLVIRELNGAYNVGVALKDVRKKVIAEYKPLMTVIDGHFSGGKIPMIQRTFNYMIYSGKLEKSGLGMYDRSSRSIFATAKAVELFEQPLRIIADDLVLPAINILRDLAAQSETGRVKTSVLFKALYEQMSSVANDEDKALNSRNEPRYMQVIRNLISHRKLDKTGLVKYHRETGEIEFIVKGVDERKVA